MALNNAIFGHLQLLSAKIDTLIQASQGTMLQNHYQIPYPNHMPLKSFSQDGFLFAKPQQQGYVVNDHFQSQGYSPQLDHFNIQGSSSQEQRSLSNPRPLDETRLLIEQIMEGQNIIKDEINNKMEVVKNALYMKFESVRSSAMELEKKIAQMTSSSNSHVEETFMENPHPSPIDYCCTIEEEEDFEMESFLFEVDVSTMELQELFGHGVREDCVKGHREKVLNGKHVEETCEKVLVVASTQEAKGSSKGSDGPSSVVVKVVDEDRDRKGKDTTTKADSNLKTPLCDLPLPFPGRFKKQLLQECYDKYYKDPLPPLDPKVWDIAKGNPKLETMLKDVDAKRAKCDEIMRKNGLLPPTKKCKKLSKLKNPGNFTVSCLLEMIHKEEALVDTGANVNVMSLDMIQRYDIKDLIKPTTSISLGDSSVKQPIGKLKDYPLKIGDCTIPTDFVIIDMKSPSKYPLLLGTPFLETVGTKIDFITKEVIFLYIDPEKTYKMVNAYDRYCGTISTQGIGDKPMEELDLNEGFDWLFGHEEDLIGIVKKPKRHSGKKAKDKPQLVIDDEEKVDDYSLVQLFSHQESYVKSGKMPFGIKDTPMMTLTPISYKDGAIEYKIRCKGVSKPFARARSVISKEMIDKGQWGMEEIMKNVLKFELVDKGEKSLGGSHSTIH